MADLKPFDGALDAPTSLQPFDGQLDGEPVKPSGAIRRLADQGIKLAQGVVGLPEAAVGVADLVTGGQAGKLAEKAGVRFKDAKDIMGEYLSPEQKAADAEVQKAEGFLPTLGAMVKNPSTIVGAAAQSAPSMLLGGGVSRGLLAVAPKIGGITAGALGEGLTSAGQNAEQIRQEDPNGTLTGAQSALQAGSGLLTAGISRASGGLANKFGVGDVQTMLATGKLGVVGKEAAQAAAKKGITRKLAEGVINEGVLQELPQSYQEQVAQNLAQGKPWDEGAAAAGAQGMLAGALMGGGANVASHLAEKGTPPLATPEVPTATPPTGPAPQIGNTPDPYISFTDGTVARKSEVDTYINGLPEDQQSAARAKIIGLAPQPADAEQPPADAQQDPGAAPVETIKPSEAMGLDPAAGPMSAAAVIAVDTGAHQSSLDQQASQQAASQQEAPFQPPEGDIAVNDKGKPLTNPIMAAVAAKKMSAATGQPWEVVNYGPRQHGIRQTGASNASQSPAIHTADSASARPGLSEPGVGLDSGMGSGTGAVVSSVEPGSAAVGTDINPVSLGAGNDAVAPNSSAPTGPTPAVPSGVESAAKPSSSGPIQQVSQPQGKASEKTTKAEQTTPQRQDAPQATAVDTPDTIYQKALARIQAEYEADPNALRLGAAKNKAKKAYEAALKAQPEVQQAKPSTPPGQQLSVFNGKYGKGMNQSAAKLKAIELNRANPDKSITYAAEEHNDPALENPWAVVGRKLSAQIAKPAAPAAQPVPVAPSAPPVNGNLTSSPEEQRKAFAEAEAIRTAPGTRARQRAHVANPFRAFLGKHGVSSALAREFVPGLRERRAAMVQGYGPIFRQTGKGLDLLAQYAVEDGFLLRADEAAMHSLIARAIRGERIIAQYAEGVADNEMGTIVQQMQAEHDDAVANMSNEDLDRISRDEAQAWQALRDISDATLFDLSDDGTIFGPRVSFDESNRESDHEITPGQKRAGQNAQGRQGAGQADTAKEAGAAGQGNEPARAGQDGIAKPLYASRAVTNSADIIAWAQSQGFKTTLPADDMHVTVAYSSQPVDGSKVGNTTKSVSIKGGARTVELLGDGGAVVLKFSSDELQSRWKQYRDAGASWDYEGYTPHVTLSYDATGIDLSEVTPYAGPIQLGTEKQEALNEDKADEYVEEPTLTAPTRADILAQQERAAQAEKDNAKADKDTEEKAKAERVAKEIQARQSSSADNFQLGQSAEDALAGQQSVFDAPAKPSAQPAAQADKPEPRTAVRIARDVGKAEPDANVTDLMEKARQAIRDEMGQKALDAMDQGSLMRSDELTQALHDGQYAAVREYAAAMPVPVHESDIPRETANRAHAGTSHSPEQRGDSARRGYVRTMVDAWKQAERSTRGDPEALARVTEVMQNTVDGYRSRYIASLEAHSRVMSSMIAGPANFPVASNQKKSDTADKRAGEADDFLKKGIARMLKAARAPIDNSPDSELARVRANLEGREAQQARMKEINAAHAKFQRDPSSLEKSGLSEQDQKLIREHKPRYSWGPHPFAPYELTNNNAEIRRLRDRLADAEKRVGEAVAGPVETTRQGVRIEENAQDDRLRLFFDGKPSEEIRTDLKSNGFRWSPNAGAWQRQLTDNARAVASRLVDKHFPDTGVAMSRGGSNAASAFSNSAKSHAIQSVERITSAISSKWANAPEIIVAFDLNDARIPERVRQEDLKQKSGGAKGTPEGFFYHGTAYLMASQVKTTNDIARVLMHEVLGHAGLRGAFGDAFKPILQQIVTFRRALVDAKIKEYGLRGVSNLDRLTAAEEVLAEMAQAHPEIGFVKRAIAAIRNWLRNNVPGFSNLKLSDADVIAAYILPARDFIERGNTQPTAPDGGSIPFSRSMVDTLKTAVNERKTTITGETGRKYTPDQLAAFKAVGFQVEAPSLKERAQALLKDAGKKLAQGIVDQFAPVRELSNQAYTLLRLSKGASGAFEVFLNGGKLKLTDGVYDFDEQDKGGVVQTLLQPLGGEHHDFFRWVAANRAERLSAEGKENLFSPQDIASLKTLADGATGFDYTIQNGIRKGQVVRDRATIYRDSLATFNQFNKNILDLSEQSGLIDGESRKVWEHEFYVPFYRVADEDDGGVRGMNVKGGMVRQQAFKLLKGGKNALNADLLDNTLMNWAHLLDAAAKNRAAKATIEAAEAMGKAVGSNQATLKQMASSVNNKNGVVWFMDGGQKRYSLLDQQDGPYLMTALTALEYAGMRNPVMNAMGSFKRALTIGVTASPFFKVRNLIRDSVQAIASGPLSYNPVKNIAQGWKLTDPKSDAYFRLMAGGGTIHFGTMMEGSEAKRVQALVESGVDSSTILNDEHKVKAFYRKFIEPGITAYNELGNRGEAINRASLYDQLVKQGMNHADASLQARDLMDFSMQGSFTTIRFLAQTVPFFNARLVGLYKLGRAAKEDPARVGAVLGATAMFSIALLAAYGDDDDWKRRTESDRDNFWWFKFGGTAFRLPKPFEIGAIATLAERGFELAFDKQMTGERFRKDVLSLIGNNLSMNPVPQLVKPILDVYANKDSFSGRAIESMGMDRLKPEYRFNDRTSMLARATSTAANSVTGLVGVDAASPVQIDHMLRGYFGWLGAFVVGAGDIIARPATDQPSHASQDMWKSVTGGMVSDLRDAPSRYVGQMYEQAKEIEQAYGTWRSLQKEGKTLEAQEFAAENRDKLSKYHGVEGVKRAETKLNNRRRMIERSNMSADEKRNLLRAIAGQQEALARPIVEVR